MASAFEKNCIELSIQLQNAADKKRIAIVGQPGSGKSTLLDILTEHACDPRPRIGQKTDATEWSQDTNTSLLHFYQDQVFVDAPGYDTKNHPVRSFTRFFPFHLFDCLMLVIKDKIYQADDEIWTRIRTDAPHTKPVVVRTYAENIAREDENDVRNDLEKHFGHQYVLISNRYQTGFRDLHRYLL